MATGLHGAVVSLLTLTLALGCGEDDAPSCEESASQLLRQCVSAYADAQLGCYAATAAECATEEPGASGALAELRRGIATRCGDGDLIGLDVAGAQARLENACVAESSSLVWRTVGGPQGAVAPSECTTAAFAEARDLIDESLQRIARCADGDCDPAAVASNRAELETAAREAIVTACPRLSSAIAVDPRTYVARAAHQADCLAATVHGSVAPLFLSCGPEHAQFEAARGEWVRVRVDGDEWGTLCGDGSGYSFWIRPAPAGAALDRVLIGLQGGGVCVFGEDCAARFASNPGLFTAEDDEPLSVTLLSDDPAVSPFADWTKVLLPYCNQDVFAGGGVVESFAEMELPRYGSVNLRASMQMVRDWLWRELDADIPSGGPGFEPGEIRALFGGWSAGSYGTLYNYHWILDDLQWPRTAAFPDAGLALDNGETLGVAGLGQIKIPAWGMRNNLPPYCFEGDCALGETIVRALSPRLLRVPEQQMLLLSNQRDTIQQGDAFFAEEAQFVNTMRRTYCDTKDLPGIQWYLTSAAEPTHVATIQPNLWTGSVDGVVMSDWFERAFAAPETLSDHAEEGDFVSLVPPRRALLLLRRALTRPA